MVICKICGSEKRGISCSLCRQRVSHKFKLINWEATKIKFGYPDNYVLQKPDVVIITCRCGESKEVLWRSIRANRCLCRSCVSKALWEDPEYRNKLDAIMSTDDWKEKHLASCQLDEHRARLSESSKQNWDNAEYRNQMVSKIREFVKTEQYLERQSAQSKRNWKRTDYRKKQHESARRKWMNPEYRQKMAKVWATQLGTVSSIQRQLYKYLDDLRPVDLDDAR